MITPPHQTANAALAPNPAPLVLKLSWDPVPETAISGYRLYGGTASRNYSILHETGNVTTFPVQGLMAGQTYYFAVKAVNAAGLEGPPSDELVVVMDPVPRAAADSYAVGRDTPLVVPAAGVLKNDADLDSAVLAAVLESSPTRGSLTLNPDGGFIYTPAAGFTGMDSFAYRATDGFHHSGPTTVNLTVSEPLVELLANGSFESGTTSWMSGGNLKVGMKAAPYLPTDGSGLMVFNGLNQTPNGILSQTFTTVPGIIYTLEFDSTLVAYNWDPQTLTVDITGKGSLLSQSITRAGDNTGLLPWRSYRYVFMADGNSATLVFRDKSLSTASVDLLLDKVSVTGPKEHRELPSVAEGLNSPSLAGRPGAVTVAMTVASAGTYVLQRSVDLVKWEVVGTAIAIAPGPVSFLDPKQPVDSRVMVFYRIIPAKAVTPVHPEIPSVPERAGTPSLTGRPGAMTVAMTVTAAGSYVLQRSEDLVKWEVVETTSSVGAGRITFVDSKLPSGSRPAMFYRIRKP